MFRSLLIASAALILSSCASTEYRAADRLTKYNRKAEEASRTLQRICMSKGQIAGSKPGQWGCVDAPKPEGAK